MEISVRRYLSAVAGLALIYSAAIEVAEAQEAQTNAPTLDSQQIEISASELRNGRADRTIYLPEGKASMIILPVEVRDVLVANPTVADVVVMSSRRIYLIGLAPGSTNAFFLDDQGNELLRLDIQVQLDVISANRSLKTLLPNSEIKITAVKSNLFLTGNVRSAGISEIAQVVASQYVADKANVINMLVVIEDQKDQQISEPAPSPAITPVVVDKPEKKNITVYRATTASTVVIQK